VRRSSLRLAVTSVAVIAVGGAALATAAPTPPSPAATPAATSCAPGSLPEKTQGRAPASDLESGRYAKGYTCNVVELSHHGKTGGYRVERYVDKAGNECAYYDTTLLFPTAVPDQGTDGPGTYVLDMKDPAKPILTDVIRTGAFSSPHESMRLNTKRGLLVAALGTPATAAGVVDVYDVSQDCRKPTLVSSTPFGLLGHEGGFSPDGNTYYVGSLYFQTLTAIDLSDPRAPKPLWQTKDYQPHGVSISDDGNTLYMAEAALDDSGFSGLTVLDVTEVQKRVLRPSVPIVSRLTWDTVSTPQNATPFTRDGRPYVMEIDEFGEGATIGAARIIDMKDVKKPKVVSNIRLAVNRAEAQGEDLEGDPGNRNGFQGYQGHYCSLPSRVDPNILACTFIMSGLRVFDISDVTKPREIAYHNRPVLPGTSTTSRDRAGSFAMSAPAYDEKTGDIWYSDGNSGFYAVRLTGSAKRAKFAGSIVNPGN
jgi:hypothetical protein